MHRATLLSREHRHHLGGMNTFVQFHVHVQLSCPYVLCGLGGGIWLCLLWDSLGGGWEVWGWVEVVQNTTRAWIAEICSPRHLFIVNKSLWNNLSVSLGERTTLTLNLTLLVILSTVFLLVGMHLSKLMANVKYKMYSIVLLHHLCYLLFPTFNIFVSVE